MTRFSDRQTIADDAADAGGQDDAEQADREAIDRMTEEQRETLNQPDLDEHETEADQREIHAAKADQPRRDPT